MNRFPYPLALTVAAMAAAGCGAGAPAPQSVPAPAPATVAAKAPESLNSLVERYWDEAAVLMPWYAWGGSQLTFGATRGGNIAPQALGDQLAIERRYLLQADAIARANLDVASRLTYDIFKRERQLAVEGFTYPFELLPVNPYGGMPLQFASMALPAERLALSSAQDYAPWRSQAAAFVRWTDQAIGNMRDGLRRGYTLPRPLVDKLLPQLEPLGLDSPANPFVRAMRAAAADTGDAERARLTSNMTRVIGEEILPAYRRLHDFLAKEYRPRSRTSVALSALPLGDAWYRYLVKRTIGTDQTVEQIHALGSSEVDRTRQRALALLADTPYAGSLTAFIAHLRQDPHLSYATASELSAAYQDLKVRVAEAAPRVLPPLPRADFAIRNVESYRESVMPSLSYRPRSPNGLIAATLFVNTGQLESRPAVDIQSLYLREAVPGHHYQLEVQHERTDLPRFRRFGGAPAFVDGWALYAATLGDELGIDRGVEDKVGPLLAQLQCAAALVVDTGLHAQGWTRRQALDYLQSQTLVDAATAEESVDRMIALPAEALACTVGYLKLQSLRAGAQQALGARFELKAFHAAVTGDGAMPLDLLDGKIKRWIDTVRESAAAPQAEPAASAVQGPGSSAAPDAAAPMVAAPKKD